MRMKRGDTYIEEFKLTWNDGSAIDLTEADHVNFICLLDGALSPKIDAPTTISDAANGMVAYDFKLEDTNNPGMYKYEFQITYNSGDILTVPSNQTLWLLILDDLNESL